MGKIRVTTIGSTEEQEEKQKKAVKKAEKKAREAAEVTVEETDQPKTAEEQSETEKDIEEKPTSNKTKKAKFRKEKTRGSIYASNALLIDKNKLYPLPEALETLKKLQKAKFDETVELHINTIEAGVSGTFKLPHSAGREIRVVIANDDVINEVEKGKINFDVLVATPDMMPKLAKVAKVLGPKGLMPNPKNGTISANPEEAAKKFTGGQMSFKTESKLPIMHLIVGKVSYTNDQLTDNIKTVIAAVKKDRILKITLKSTMSPAIRLQV